MKSKTVAYLLWFFLGGLSVHRFYLGKVGSGILYLVTFQLFFIGWFVDAFLLSGMVDTCNIKNGFYGNQGGLSQNVVVNVVNHGQEPLRDRGLEKRRNDVVDSSEEGFV
jgi:TM2 domain-containing membrane protein YozV